MQINQLDLGQIYGNVEAIKGARLQNQLGQQKLQANEMMMQKEAQFNPLLQNYLANPSKENAQALFAADPQRGMEVIQQRHKLDQQRALQTYTIANAVVNSDRPLELLKNGYPGAFDEFAGELLNMGYDINEMSPDQIKSMAKSIATEAGTMAGIDVQGESLKTAQAEADLQSTRASTNKTIADTQATYRGMSLDERKMALEEIKFMGAQDEAKTKEQKTKAAAQSAMADTQSTIGVVDRILESDGWANAFGRRIPGYRFIPGTPAADLRAQVDTLKARLGFAELQKMRANSPTGGALGQVSERELKFLQAANQSLDFNQSEEQVRENMMLIKQSLERLEAVQAEAAGLIGGGSTQTQSDPEEGTMVEQNGVTYKKVNGKWVAQ